MLETLPQALDEAIQQARRADEAETEAKRLEEERRWAM